MTIDQQLMDTISKLPPEKKSELLDFAKHLRDKSEHKAKRPWKSLMGALAHHNVNITEEDIAQARREMWGNFPRSIE
jgi:hypothetical protein